MPFDLDPSYKQVPERIADFKAKHPDGCLRPVDPSRPFWFEEVDGQRYVVYVAAAYRSPDDPLPGIGAAWEPVPGRTPYTKLSELQNAETSAWGRAIVAVLASESKSVASAEDVRNRAADHDAPEPEPALPPEEVERREAAMRLLDEIKSMDDERQRGALAHWLDQQNIPRAPGKMTTEQIGTVTEWLHLPSEPPAEPTIDGFSQTLGGLPEVSQGNPGASLHDLTDEEREMALVGAMKPGQVKDALRQRGMLDESDSEKVMRNRLMMAMRSERTSA